MSYAAKASNAIKTLGERGGSSLAAIKKVLAATGPVNAPALNLALKKGVASGVFTKVKASYKLVKKVLPKKIKKKVVRR